MTPSLQRALLIDDEASARDDLRRLLAAHPEIAVVGEAGRLAEAGALLARETYDLVFLDVQLRGGTGFELMPQVRPGARVIFVTAHDRYAFRAFEVNALDYLLKPVHPARLAEALRRAAAVTPPATATTALRPDDIVQVKTGPGTARFVRVADLVLVQSEDNYSSLLLAGEEHLLVRQTLTAWEQRLPETQFMRVHRQFIVNLRCIEGYSHESDETTLLRLAHVRTPVRARRQHWPVLTARLAALGVQL